MRWVVIVSFLVAFSWSLSIFVSKKRQPTRIETLKKDQTHPRVSMVGAQFTRMHETIVDQKLTADVAEFFEPNIIRLTGHVVGMRHNKNLEETLNTGAAEVLLETKEGVGIAAGSKPKTVVMTQGVAIHTHDNSIETQDANYNATDELVTTDKEVRVFGPERTMKGNGGFKYSMRTGDFSVAGRVEGTLIPKAGRKH